MSEASQIPVPSRLARVMAFFLGGYAFAPLHFLAALMTGLFAGLVPRLQLTMVYIPATQAVLMVPVYLALGWFVPRGPLFNWVLTGFLVVHVVPLVIGTGITVFSAGDAATPYAALEVILLQSAGLSVLPFVALFAGAWLRRRKHDSLATDKTGEEAS